MPVSPSVLLLSVLSPFRWCPGVCPPARAKLSCRRKDHTFNTMATLDLDDIPSNINTFERLAVWAVQCLQSIANGEEVNVVAGAASVPIAQAQLAVTADNVDRFILTAYVPISRDAINSPTAKTWMAALDVSEAQPHTNLLTN